MLGPLGSEGENGRARAHTADAAAPRATSSSPRAATPCRARAATPSRARVATPLRRLRGNWDIVGVSAHTPAGESAVERAIAAVAAKQNGNISRRQLIALGLNAMRSRTASRLAGCSGCTTACTRSAARRGRRSSVRAPPSLPAALVQPSATALRWRCPGSGGGGSSRSRGRFRPTAARAQSPSIARERWHGGTYAPSSASP